MWPDAKETALLEKVDPFSVQDYARATGWQRARHRRPEVAVYHRQDSELAELVIPQTREFADYGQRMGEVLDTLARYEARSPHELVADLLLPAADVVRFRLDDHRTAAGIIPLGAGLDFYEGTRRALLSAACSVLQPRPFHPRLSRTDAEQFVENCRIKAEPPSSFLATVVCPLGEVVSQRELTLPGTDEAASAPFARRAVLYLMRSLERLVDAVLDGTTGKLSGNEPQDAGPILSANLCEALLAMRPEGERSSLEITPTWSRSRPWPVAAPGRVTLRREFFPTIEELGQRLRPRPKPKRGVFTGWVDALNGDYGLDGKMEGEVVLALAIEDGDDMEWCGPRRICARRITRRRATTTGTARPSW